MTRLPKLKYVKFVRSKGAIYAYFNTGRKVGGKLVWSALPAPSSVGFHDSYAVMLGHRSRREEGFTVAKLADDFEASPEFKRLALNTQRLYRLTLARVRAQFGKFPVDGVERKHVREVVNNRIEGNGARNIFLSVVGVLYRFARQRDLSDREPTKDIAQFPMGQHEPWPQDLLDAGLKAEHDRTRLAINLLFYTGQRIGDVVKMRWSDYRDGAIYLTQQKTGKALRIPVHSSLADEMARTPRKGITIIVNHIGQPMTPQVIRRELKEFGGDVVPHGLRKNAVNALLEAGCTIGMVAGITGQSFKVIEHYARRVDQHQMAEAAIFNLENKAGKFNRNVKPGDDSPKTVDVRSSVG